MTEHDFIFSCQRHHRFARHAIFWMLWALCYFFLFHIPVYEFKGWGFDAKAAPATFTDIRRIGLVLFIIKAFVFNSLLAVIVPQAIFTSILIHHILPNYLFKKGRLFLGILILTAVLLVFYLVAVQCKWFVVVGDYLFGLRHWPASRAFYNVAILSVLRDQFSSLPIVAGLAVMIKLGKRWWLKQQEIQQIAKEKTRAELQLLKAQIHPHFLFNTLNNIYYFTLTLSPQAPVMLKKLRSMLHYIIHECDRPLVPLEKEISLVKDYVSLEKIRYGEQMEMSVEIPVSSQLPTNAKEMEPLIAPLLLIPFIENSFKHGASKMIVDPWVKLRIRIENDRLHFSIQNSRPNNAESLTEKNGIGNIGLNNVTKRLRLLYPTTHVLQIESAPGSFAVYLKVPLHESTAIHTDKDLKKAYTYAMA